MLINMRNAMTAGGGLSAKSYVQDGLVAMWDGIENAGWGTHDPNATVWKNLMVDSPFGDWNIQGIGDDYVAFNNSSQSKSISYNMPMTVEVRLFDSTLNGGVFLNFGGISDYSALANNGFLLPYFEAGGRMDWYTKRLHVNSTKLTSCFTALPKSSNLTVYRDGELLGSVTNTNSMIQSSLKIGGYASKSISTKASYIRLYSRALTADEIAANYAVDKARFNLPDAT